MNRLRHEICIKINLSESYLFNMKKILIIFIVLDAIKRLKLNYPFSFADK